VVSAGISTALLRTVRGSNWNLLATSYTYPNLDFEVSYDVASFVIMVGLPLITMAFFASFVSMLITEKHSKLHHMLHSQGMRPQSYWIANYIYYFSLSFMNGILYICIAYVAGLREFKRVSFPLWLALMAMWSHAQICMAILLAAIGQRSKASAIAAYVLKIVIAIAAPIMYTAVHVWPNVLLFIPPLAFIRLLQQTLDSFHPQATLNMGLGYLCLFGVCSVLMLFGIYLFLVIPVPGGVSSDPFLCLRRMLRSVRRRERSMSLDISEAMGQMEGGEEDQDVAAERLRVCHATPLETEKMAIRIAGITKTFPGRGAQPPKTACDRVTLAIEYGECFGLLGPNGAGKTTLIQVISGAVPPTRGSARIADFDVVDDLDSIYRVIGVCPQHDVVWDDLTTREHLMLYARLKGVPQAEEAAITQQVAEQVGLDGDAIGQPAKELSGGMKRRLSIGVAMVGAPRIIYLDEPTTGLDPETRASIWGIINRAKVGRAILLTTHSMEEADTLSTRIAIMAKGSVKCIGSPLHLKSRFGEGYQLKLNLRDPLLNLDDIITRHLCGESRLTYSFGRSRTYNLPKGSVEVSNVFQTMEANKDAWGIDEWGIDQTSLEQVFLKIVRESEAEE
jgi:ABC-type multidrug transport system ATPase subunit